MLTVVGYYYIKPTHTLTHFKESPSNEALFFYSMGVVPFTFKSLI